MSYTSVSTRDDEESGGWNNIKKFTRDGQIGESFKSAKTLASKSNWAFLWINVAKAVGMLVLSIVALAVGLKEVEKPFPIIHTSSVLEGPQTLITLNNLNLVPLAAISSLVLFVYACFMILVSFILFKSIIATKQNVSRWIAYAFSQSFQVLLVIILVGINEISAVVIFTVAQFMFVFLQGFLERISSTTNVKSAKWIRYGLMLAILVCHGGIWALIFYYAYDFTGSIPPVIPTVVIGTFVFITLTALTNFTNTIICIINPSLKHYFVLTVIYDVIEVLYAIYFVLAFTIGVTTFSSSS